MTKPRLQPETITKPIQLLAAWLAGLVLVNGGFLSAAAYIKEPPWATGVLVVAAVLNVPLFLVALFLLQTRFRPEMQEDTYYFKYLEKKYSTSTETAKPLDVRVYAKELAEHIMSEIGSSEPGRREPIEKAIQESQIQELVRSRGNARTLSELFLRPEIWPAIAGKWKDRPGFEGDLTSLLTEGLVSGDTQNPHKVRLTELGRQVAEIAQEKGLLWSQTHEDYWDQQGKIYEIPPENL